MRLIDADRLKRQVEGRSWRAKGKMVELIDNSPTVEPVKTGRWIVHTDKFANGAEYFGYAVCSECGDMFNCMETIGLKPIWDYCPNCGARMFTEGENA